MLTNRFPVGFSTLHHSLAHSQRWAMYSCQVGSSPSWPRQAPQREQYESVVVLPESIPNVPPSVACFPVPLLELASHRSLVSHLCSHPCSPPQIATTRDSQRAHPSRTPFYYPLYQPPKDRDTNGYTYEPEPETFLKMFHQSSPSLAIFRAEKFQD